MLHVEQDRNCRILIVDDTPQNIQVIASALQNGDIGCRSPKMAYPRLKKRDILNSISFLWVL